MQRRVELPLPPGAGDHDFIHDGSASRIPSAIHDRSGVPCRFRRLNNSSTRRAYAGRHPWTGGLARCGAIVVGVLLAAYATGCTVVDETGSTEDGAVATPSDEAEPRPTRRALSPTWLPRHRRCSVMTVDGDDGSTASTVTILDRRRRGRRATRATPSSRRLRGAAPGARRRRRARSRGRRGRRRRRFSAEEPGWHHLLSWSDVRPTCTTLDAPWRPPT